MLECNYGNICKQFKHHALTSALRIFFASENAGVYSMLEFYSKLTFSQSYLLETLVYSRHIHIISSDRKHHGFGF